QKPHLQSPVRVGTAGYRRWTLFAENSGYRVGFEPASKREPKLRTEFGCLVEAFLREVLGTDSRSSRGHPTSPGQGVQPQSSNSVVLWKAEIRQPRLDPFAVPAADNAAEVSSPHMCPV
ncbi:unnamed protein product, partial [Ixodes pacificus]